MYLFQIIQLNQKQLLIEFTNSQVFQHQQFLNFILFMIILEDDKLYILLIYNLRHFTPIMVLVLVLLKKI